MMYVNQGHTINVKICVGVNMCKSHQYYEDIRRAPYCQECGQPANFKIEECDVSLFGLPFKNGRKHYCCNRHVRVYMDRDTKYVGYLITNVLRCEHGIVR